jgi:hypothetical protein
VHDAVHRGQAHAAALADLLGAEEGLEHAFQHLRRDARPLSITAQFQVASGDRLPARGASGALLRAGTALPRSARCMHGVARVDAQIHQDLLELHRVEHGRGSAGSSRVLSSMLGGQCRAEQLHRLGDQRGQRKRARLAALAAAEGEHLLDQVAGALAGRCALSR